MVLVGFGCLPRGTQLGMSGKSPPRHGWVLAGTTLERGESTAGAARRWGQPTPGSAWLQLPPKIIKPHPGVSAAEGKLIFIFRPLSRPGHARAARGGEGGGCSAPRAAEMPFGLALGWLLAREGGLRVR